MERRNFLRLAFGSLIVGGAALTAINLLGSLQRPRFITVKAVYFQMQQFVNLSDEAFELPDPASLSTLLSAITQRHSVLSLQMMASMLILVNNEAVRGLDFALKDGDVINFIPLVTGG